jgi:hypothetical protein
MWRWPLAFFCTTLPGPLDRDESRNSGAIPCKIFDSMANDGKSGWMAHLGAMKNGLDCRISVLTWGLPDIIDATAYKGDRRGR